MIHPSCVLGFSRCFSSHTPNVKELIKKLRSDTGLSYIKIKEALQATKNDPDKARRWLLQKAEEENWTKAQKLGSRTTSQGLTAVLADSKSISLGKIQCETDFVAKNSAFISLMHQFLCKLPELGLAGHISGTTLLENSYANTLLLKTIGSLGENIQPQQFFHHEISGNQSFATYVHGKIDNPFDNLKVGKISSGVLFKNLDDNNLKACIAQHVVGTLPTGTPLLEQEFLHDDTMTIGDLCKRYSFEIVNFCRLSYSD